MLTRHTRGTPITRRRLGSSWSGLLAATFLALMVLCEPATGVAEEPAAEEPAAEDPSEEVFGHDDWTLVLEAFVDDRGFVDYAGLAEDRAGLDQYVARIEVISPESHPDHFPSIAHELAYYINAYNALVFKGVLARGEIDSVWGKTQSGYGFFVGQKVQLGGKRTNLRKLENEVIRKVYADPRIHAALNCASIACPRLPQEAFVAEQLDAQLDAAIVEFVSTEPHVRVDESAGVVYLSKIFDWFRSDFEEFEAIHGQGELLDYINRYRSADEQVPPGVEIRFAAYDKGLNAQ